MPSITASLVEGPQLQKEAASWPFCLVPNNEGAQWGWARTLPDWLRLEPLAPSPSLYRSKISADRVLEAGQKPLVFSFLFSPASVDTSKVVVPGNTYCRLFLPLSFRTCMHGSAYYLPSPYIAGKGLPRADRSCIWYGRCEYLLTYLRLQYSLATNPGPSFVHH